MKPKQCTDNTSDENDINHDNNNINDTNNDNIENNNDDENNNDENNDDKNNNDNKDNSNNNARIWKYRLQHIRHFVSASVSWQNPKHASGLRVFIEKVIKHFRRPYVITTNSTNKTQYHLF